MALHGGYVAGSDEEAEERPLKGMREASGLWCGCGGDRSRLRPRAMRCGTCALISVGFSMCSRRRMVSATLPRYGALLMPEEIEALRAFEPLGGRIAEPLES